ncbi:MAG TPA: 2OG-Fe(II) oxygenase [Allosphingosinicella sp.]|nr:2OG-Fe(II) oxygenase [Allosphingosinicella sp.]
MDPQAAQAPSPPAADAARERVSRQKASLASSAGWLLNIVEFYCAVLPPEGASASVRLRRAARTLTWTSPQQERLAFFAERYAALDAEADRALADPRAAPEALAAIAVRLEQAASEALTFYVALQSDAQRAQELSRTTAAEENQPSRLAARAGIGASVRACLSQAGAQKMQAAGLELYRIPLFFAPDECAAIVDLIERDLHPSRILGDQGDREFRTSKSCNLQPSDPIVDSFETRVCALLGINRRFSETVQGQRYEVGQQFKPHYDYFFASESYYEDAAARGGQRTWTAMLFLNEPESGGRTDFPTAGASAAPETGTLLVWNNMAPDGRCNSYALHHGTPVLAGRKYVLTKWFRERQWIF